MSTHILNSPDVTSQDPRQGERRRAPRIAIPSGVPLTAEVETPNRILLSIRCINLSAHGALLEFGEGKGTGLNKGGNISVIIKLAGKVSRVPGIIRHRTDSRLGISFNLESLEQSPGDEQALAGILQILERAVERRKSMLVKDPTAIPSDQPPPAHSSGQDQNLSNTHPPVFPEQDRRKQDRRGTVRLPILQGIPLKTEVVTPDRILRTVRCVNLSSRGALLDFGSGKCPPLAHNEQVLVNFQIASDTANLPGLVRHRTENQLGVEFPFDEQPQLKDQEQTFGRIIQTLERAVARRRGR